MSSRPKTQESLLKPKSAMQSGDSRNRNHLNLSSSKSQEKGVAEISMEEFLDFLKISYQVNDAIDNPSSDIAEKTSVDWKKLTSDALIGRLKEREAALIKESFGKKKSDSQEKVDKNSDKTTWEEIVSGSELSSNNVTRQNSDEKLENKPSAELATNHSFFSEKLSTNPVLDRKPVWDKSKRSGMGWKKNSGSKKDSSAESETSRSFDSAGEDRTPAKLLKKKLNEVLQEGILDSVLPYLLPKQQQQIQDNSNANVIKKSHASSDVKRSNCGNSEKSDKIVSSIKEKLEARRKSLNKNDISFKNDKKDVEVVIHVCDEIKNLKRDFKCSQKLLTSQMGYFAEVTTGQKLEDMDISVHCDVTIFDWLMRWVQKDSLSEEHWPTLDCSIVVPVLMSSAFLQMNSLQEHCLHYCKTHINDIIRDSPNLGCINDNVLTRLANLFCNTEIENIVDKKDKIQSKLFCKLITALSEREPQPERGHYFSLATIYRCSKCLKLILKNMSGSIFCIASNMTMDRNGFLHSTHVYDSSWNLTDYVRDLKVELKTWRKVYWKLWSDCHLLFCQSCEEYFPVSHMNRCRFHIESVQYFPVENQRSITYPIGRYPCCGERAYRFEIIKKTSGCQYRDHITNLKTAAEVEIFRIWNLHKEVLLDELPPSLPPDKRKYVKASKEDTACRKSPLKDGYWWEGLELVPTKQPLGLLSKLWDTVIKKDNESKIAGSNLENKNPKSLFTKVVPAPQTSIQDASSFSDSSDESCTSSNAGNSEESYHSSTKVVPKAKSSYSSSQYLASARLYYTRKEKKKKKRKKKKNSGVKNEGNRFWLSKLSTRCNQDNQREFEEKVLRQIESILAKKLSGESFRTTGSRSSYQVVPAGGIYVKLEQEWREAHCFSHGCPGSSIKARGSASYVNVNNTNFSLQKRSKSRGHR